MLGVISNIQRFTVHDGPGIRLTVFMQGCPLSCWWCHNPECIKHYKVDDNSEHLRYDVKELMKEIRKEQIFIDESGGGVTFSGGEPMMQPIFLGEILDACKKEDIHTAVDTSGLVSSDTFDSIIDKADLFLYDLKIIDNALHQKYTGTSNTLILKNLKTLNDQQKKVIIRMPLIPGMTDSKQNIDDVIKLLSLLSNIKNINLLPYHSIAEGKYTKYNIPYKMKDVKVLSENKITEIKNLFTNAGFNASIGG
ncbi:MAG: pyruvate formate lyase-activating protein [Bacteroidetes bacterium]|nr:pyruvate formate lyase-activating protein [Bacteroidota bacterium]